MVTKMKIALGIVVILALSCWSHFQHDTLIHEDPRIVSYIVDPSESRLQFFLKNGGSERYKNFSKLKEELALENIELKFAMNGGMFTPEHKPVGLYIEEGQVLSNLDTILESRGNFYLQPNGVFLIDKFHKPSVVTTDEFEFSEDIEYATQSGPMLLVNGEYHPAFNKESKNLNIRNGVGILKNGYVLFAMTNEKMNFYDFASFFKKNGCSNALYLDGAISKIYTEGEASADSEGNFGVIIGEVVK